MSTKINGIEGLTTQDVLSEIEKGAKFVIYTYCISIIVMTFKRSSDIYFIKSGEGSVGKGVSFTIVSMIFGWWGIPWGPIYTIGALVTNFSGGKDITDAVKVQLKTN